MNIMKERRRMLLATLKGNPKFTINGIEYEFEKGMNWAQFASSQYNDGRITFDGSYVLFDDRYHVELGTPLMKSSIVITPDAAYTAKYRWIFKTGYGTVGAILYDASEWYIPMDSNNGYVWIDDISNVVFGTAAGSKYNLANYTILVATFKNTSSTNDESMGFSSQIGVYPNNLIVDLPANKTSWTNRFASISDMTYNQYFWVCTDSSRSNLYFKNIYLR